MISRFSVVGWGRIWTGEGRGGGVRETALRQVHGRRNRYIHLVPAGQSRDLFLYWGKQGLLTGTLRSEDLSRSEGMPGSMPGGNGEMDTEWGGGNWTGVTW